MLINLGITVLGFIGLVWGSDKFAVGASALARNLGVSQLVIGLFILAFGTSAPEIFSSAVSALEGKPELAVGNALGSNIFNVGVALGIAALISPLKVPPGILKTEIPVLLLVTIFTGLLMANLYLGLIDALLLIGLTGLLAYKAYLMKIRSREGRAKEEEYVEAVDEFDLEQTEGIGNGKSLFLLALGLVLLIVSAKALVMAATAIAESLGVSTAVIGLTVVALGTSLPELAVSVTCVLKGHYDLAIGNIVGSNILNLLAVLPFPGLFSPDPIEPMLLYRDYSAVLFLTLLLSFFCYMAIKRGKMIGRLYGASFLFIYGAWFTVMLVQLQS